MNHIKDLFDFHEENFLVWKDEKYYYISVEGYLGYENLEEVIQLYEEFIDKFNLFLIENNYEEPSRLNPYWKRIYQTRAIDIAFNANCYWIFLEGYKSKNIYELLWYMEDIVNQLVSLNRKLSDE